MDFNELQKVFPMNALNNGSIVNTDEAKTVKAFPTFG